MAEVEWFEREARLEVRSPMRVGMRVVFALADGSSLESGSSWSHSEIETIRERVVRFLER